MKLTLVLNIDFFLTELCRSKKSREIKAFAMATMGVLCHGNQPAKDMIMNVGGLRTLLSLCSAVEDGSNTGRICALKQKFYEYFS